MVCIGIIKFNQTPYEFILDQKNQGVNYQPAELLYQEELGDDRTIVFYFNRKGRVACEIVERSIITYKTLVKSAELLIPGENENEHFLYSRDEDTSKWIFWGIITDKSIEDIKLNNSSRLKTTNIDIYDFRICYVTGNEPIDDVEFELIY
jgi:hypothetical protein